MVVTGNFDCSFEIPITLRHVFNGFRKQQFSLPSGTIHYMTFTPSNPAGYAKLIQTCKCFTFKKRIIIVSDFYVKEESNDLLLDYLTRIEALSDALPYSLWLTSALHVGIIMERNILSRLLKNVYLSNLKDLNVIQQQLNFEEFLHLIDGGNIERFTFANFVVKYGNDNIVPFESLLLGMPKLTEMKCTYTEASESPFTVQTSKNLAKLNLDFLRNFELYDKYPRFSAEDFSTFITNNNGGSFELTFYSSFNNEWFKILQTSLKNSSYKITKKEERARKKFSDSEEICNLTVIAISHI